MTETGFINIGRIILNIFVNKTTLSMGVKRVVTVNCEP